MKLLISLFLLTLTVGAAPAQRISHSSLPRPLSQVFTRLNANLVQAMGSSVAWGDYNGDGRLDLLVTGEYAPDEMTCTIYRNNGGSGEVFTPINANLRGLSLTGVAWGDFDNDGDLDLLIAGFNGGSFGTCLYRQDSAGVFVDVGSGMTGIWCGAVAWGDYDNDGDLDILMSGSQEMFNSTTTILRNDVLSGGGFVDMHPALPALRFSSVAWGDYDNDGDLDVLLTGSQDTGRVTRVFRNDGGGVFTDIHSPLVNVGNGSAAWGDCDSDGDLDILLTGVVDAYGDSSIATIYRNEGDGTFVNISPPFVPVGGGVWGDFDNDGDLDVLLTGFRNMVGHQTRVYRNDGNDIFVDILEDSLLWGPDGSRDIAWGDFDGDGDLDIARAGTSVFRNDGSFPANHPPSAPSVLQSVVHGDSVVLRWHRGVDAETPARGLSYNIHVRPASGGPDVVSPMADPFTGVRRVPAMGNANLDTTRMIKHLKPGTYLWSVQTIDNSFAGSVFAGEVTFTIHPDGVPPVDVETAGAFQLMQNYPNPFNPTTEVRFVIGDVGFVSLKVFDVLGREVSTLVNERKQPGRYQVVWNGAGVSSGVYFYKLESNGRVEMKRMILMK